MSEKTVFISYRGGAAGGPPPASLEEMSADNRPITRCPDRDIEVPLRRGRSFLLSFRQEDT